MTPGPAASPPRLRSLDALRGFDMFWITGGSALVVTLASTTDVALFRALAHQVEHVEWHGFRLWDLVFPLFLFVAGAAVPFSLLRRIEAGDSKSSLSLRVLRRVFLLVLLGVVYNGLFTFDLTNQRYASVLGRIGLAYGGAAWIAIHFGRRGRIAWTLALLVGYWAALRFVPVPGFGAGDLRPGATLTDYVDRLLVPGRLHRGDRDPEGLLATLPAIATTLLGVFAGEWLRSSPAPPLRRGVLLFAASIAVAGVGWLWSLSFPLNKNLWTSSFALWTAGISGMLLATFYVVIDVWGHGRWAFFFVVIGSNAILIYMLEAFVDFEGCVRLVLAKSERRLHPAFFPGIAILLRWGLLYVLYRRRIFLRL